MNDKFQSGYELAGHEYSVISAKPHTSREWVEFFRRATDSCADLYEKSGVAAFITEMEAKNLDVGSFNKELSQLAQRAKQYGDDFRIVDMLLPRPELREHKGNVIEIPLELRPIYHYDSWSSHGMGKLGRIYMREVGMHMYLPHCDIYDIDNPDVVVCECEQLDATSVKTSELLSALQQILDPDKKFQRLSDAIARCKGYENNASALPGLLRKYNVGVVNLSTNGWHRINYQHIHAESLFAELDERDYLKVTLKPEPWIDDNDNPFDATEKNYDLSDFIKEAVNRARTPHD